MSGGSSELLEVQEKLQALSTEFDKANDEWNGKLAAQQDEFQREKYALQQDFSARLAAAKEDAEVKNVEIVAELEKFRRAFTGDTLGWAAAKDEQGNAYYYNSETGESDYDKPRILEIAEVVQNMDVLDEGKKKQEKAITKGKEAELQARKLEVSLNGVRSEAAALRKAKKEWEACGTVITSLCTAMSTTMDDTAARVTKVERRIPVVNKAIIAVTSASAKLGELGEALHARDATIERLHLDLVTATIDAGSSRDRADKLEARFMQAVEERVDAVKIPLEDELAAAYAGRQEEKALRESDRRYLADLWPEGWLVPSMLRRFRTMSPEERAQQNFEMEEVEAERDLVEGIRAGVAAAAKWEVKNDDYGRVYYANWETGEAAYDPPLEVGFRPPLGRNELGEKVDPRLQALREWEQGTDGWGKPYWQNARSGEVVQIEPKGWSEAMGLGEHELEGWEGPSKTEVATDVAAEAARVVVTWLCKARETEETRKREAAEPVVLGGNTSDAEDEDDEDLDEFVYDIQAVEELAMGDEGWTYQRSAGGAANCQGKKKMSLGAAGHAEEENEVNITELRIAISKLARREERSEFRLQQIRRNLEDLAHDLLAAKKRQEKKTHRFAVGHSYKQVVEEEMTGGEAPVITKRGAEEEPKNSHPESADVPSEAAAATASTDDSRIETDGSLEEGQVDHGASLDTPNETTPLAPAPDEPYTQAPGKHATEAGQDRNHQQVAEQQKALDDDAHVLPPPLPTASGNTTTGKRPKPRAIPDSIAEEVGERAFPRAEEGVACEAFHSLAAEAVWAGFNGSERVEKPSGSVWDPRGGDRWGTAAFFADRLGEREEEAVPGLPTINISRPHKGKEGGGGGGRHPLSESSARHSTARTIVLASVSSRRGFLKQAIDAAAKEARQRMQNATDKRTATRFVTERDGEDEHAGVAYNTLDSSATSNTMIGLDKGGGTVAGIAAKSGANHVVSTSDQCDGDGDPLVRSAVMLSFGAEAPGHASSAGGTTVQFPIPGDWDDPETREKQHAAQMARRKETLEILRVKDQAAMVRPKGYEPNNGLEGYEDARELLIYEAIVVEEMLHRTLLDISETREILEAGRIKSATRWDRLAKGEERVLAGLTAEISRNQTMLAKLTMEIRGLRVPLVEPQPPPAPTLDPGKIRPPTLVPDATKMRLDEVDEMIKKIRGGNYDGGEEISPPGGKTLTSKQLDEVTAVVRERQAKMAAMLAEETVRYDEAVGVYEYKHREWNRLEAERKKRLSVQCHKSRLDHLSLDNLAGLKRSHGEHLALLRLEASADKTNAALSQEAKQRFQAMVAKQIAEEARAHEWLLQLQVELSDALVDREALERLPDAALNRLDMLRWEQRRADRMVECRRRVAELREALVEEGRRRRQLYGEKRWAAQSELRRVLSEKVAVQEKEGMLRLMLKVGEATLASRESTLKARMREAEEDKDGTGTEGTVDPGEIYFATREWFSDGFRQADTELKGWEEKLAEVQQIRALARTREGAVGELVLGAARGALPPPHPDQWLPKADRERHEDEVRLLLERHQREVRAEKEAVEASHKQVQEAVREAAILRAKLKAIEGWRENEIHALRTAGRDAVDSIKGLLKKQREESAARIDKLEQALSDIRKEYNEVRAELTARIGKINRGRSNTEAWVKALKHDLGTERAKRETADEHLAIATDAAKVSSEKLRTELRAERMHSLRLELWIAALHDEIRRHEIAQEELKRQAALDREAQEKKLAQERHNVWRNRTAVRLLCMNVDSLFLFFTQRLANLAGSRRIYNDALRANGAVDVLAAVCRGPRKDLRRFAAKALGALGWDGHTEARVLAWDIYRQWDLWVESCCPNEEERLRLRGLTFEAPEQFRHRDQRSPRTSAENDLGTRSADEKVSAKMVQRQEYSIDEEHEIVASEDVQAPTTASREEESEETDRCSKQAKSGNVDEVRDHLLRHSENIGLQTANSCEGSEGRVLVEMDQTREKDMPGRRQDAQSGMEGEEKEVEEFRPTAMMSARAVVRERRQWALRRARRQEGPNEANQLQLGGGPHEIGKAWTAAAGSSIDGKKEKKDAAQGGGSVVALLVHLCQDRNDREVVRAAVAALSVAAYHEANAGPMGRAAANLIPILVALLSNADAEVQAHSATALANLAHGSPAYQSEAGQAGAIEALLDVCRGRTNGTVSSSDKPNAQGAEAQHRIGVVKDGQNESKSITEDKEENEGGVGGRWARKREILAETTTGEIETGEEVALVAAHDGGKGDTWSEDDGVEDDWTAETMDVDAVQAATAALANLLCYSDANSCRLVAAGGIGVLVGLVSSFRAHNLLDTDQVEEIQANAAEALVNATRNHGEEAAARVQSLGISPLVLMCGSDNMQVRRHAALVLGNVCQTDAHRATAGDQGAVEGLFALCDVNDGVVRANALWALGNLAWDPHNQERIGRYATQLFDLVSSPWLPVRTNALVCLGNTLFFHEANRRRVENIDGALLTLVGYCGKDHHAPVQEAALRCLVSLTYVDRIVAPLVEAGCIRMFVSNLAASVPTAVRHPAALALLNVSVHDRYKAQIADAGGVEAAVALLGSDDSEERDLAARILAEIASTEAEEGESGGDGKKEQFDLPHLLGIIKMDGNLPAQKRAAEQISQISTDAHKQQEMGDCGGVEVLLGMCDPKCSTEPRLLVPVLWGLRNCLHNNVANQDRFARSNGLEMLAQLCHLSRSACEWRVAEGVLMTLVTASLGNEKICRRLIRVGLDQLIDAAEDDSTLLEKSEKAGAMGVRHPFPASPGAPNFQQRKHLPAIPRGISASAQRPGGPRGPAADVQLGLDQIDEIGVDGVLQQSAEALARNMKRESRQTCSSLATSLLQTLGPFNYVVCGHCGAREKGGTTCSQCGYAISFDLAAQDDQSSCAAGTGLAEHMR